MNKTRQLKKQFIECNVRLRHFSQYAFSNKIYFRVHLLTVREEKSKNYLIQIVPAKNENFMFIEVQHLNGSYSMLKRNWKRTSLFRKFSSSSLLLSFSIIVVVDVLRKLLLLLLAIVSLAHITHKGISCTKFIKILVRFLSSSLQNMEISCGRRYFYFMMFTFYSLICWFNILNA